MDVLGRWNLNGGRKVALKITKKEMPKSLSKPRKGLKIGI